MPHRRPTLQDVADATGLALATVSYALRGERGSDLTRARVREAADSLGYRVDPIASALAGGRTMTVAVLCSSTRDTWQQTLAADLARALMAGHRHALVADADGSVEREAALLDRLLGQRPDGLLVTPVDPLARTWGPIARRVPTVSIGDRLSAAPEAGAVVFDNRQGIGRALGLLAELGHREVLVLLTNRAGTPDRPAGDLVASDARRLGLRVTTETLAPGEDAVDAVTGALGRRPDTTAVFGLTDAFAHAALRAAARLGLRVPDDLSVLGYENAELGDLVGPGLTTFDWDRPRIVELAVAELQAVVEGEAPQRTVLGPRLVTRGSTGPARAG